MDKSAFLLQVYEMMSLRGFSPTATTYTALISAYGKADQLDNALATFAAMVSLIFTFTRCNPMALHSRRIGKS